MPEIEAWVREAAIDAFNLQLLRLNKRLLLLNLRLLKLNAELLKNAERKTPLMNRLLRRLRRLRLDAFWRLRKVASTGKAVDDPGLELVRLEVADLMRLIEALNAEELALKRRTGG